MPPFYVNQGLRKPQGGERQGQSGSGERTGGLPRGRSRPGRNLGGGDFCNRLSSRRFVPREGPRSQALCCQCFAYALSGSHLTTLTWGSLHKSRRAAPAARLPPGWNRSARGFLASTQYSVIFSIRGSIITSRLITMSCGMAFSPIAHNSEVGCSPQIPFCGQSGGVVVSSRSHWRQATTPQRRKKAAVGLAYWQRHHNIHAYTILTRFCGHPPENSCRWRMRFSTVLANSATPAAIHAFSSVSLLSPQSCRTVVRGRTRGVRQTTPPNPLGGWSGPLTSALGVMLGVRSLWIKKHTLDSMCVRFYPGWYSEASRDDFRI